MLDPSAAVMLYAVATGKGDTTDAVADAGADATVAVEGTPTGVDEV